MDIKIQNLSVSLDKNQILSDISMDLAPDKMNAIIGPNGSGKSTLLKSIYNYIKNYDGLILMDGKDLKSIRPRDLAKRLSVVTQFHKQEFDFKVEEIVSLARNVHLGPMEDLTKRDKEIVRAAMEAVDLYDKKNRPVTSLSGGERQRVELARAMAQEGDCMVLDEPGNHLDISHQIRLMRTIKDMGITIVAAMHNIELAAIYFDKIFVLKEGRLVASGKPEQIIHADLIEEVYSVHAHVSRDPVTENINISYFK